MGTFGQEHLSFSLKRGVIEERRDEDDQKQTLSNVEQHRAVRHTASGFRVAGLPFIWNLNYAK